MALIEPVYKVIDDTQGEHRTLAIYKTEEAANLSCAARQAADDRWPEYYFVEPAVPSPFDSVLETFTSLEDE